MMKSISKKINLICVGFIGLLWISPLIYIFCNSFMHIEQISEGHIQFIPKLFTLSQYTGLLIDKNAYFLHMENSIVLVIGIVIGKVIISSLAAYGLSLEDSWISKMIFFVFIVFALTPIQVNLVSNFLSFDIIKSKLQIDMYNSTLTLISLGVFNSLGIILLRQFIIGIDKSLIEAAKIDGAGSFRIFFSIIIPIIRPAIVTLILLTIIDTWNLIEAPLIFIRDMAKMPLSAFMSEIFAGDFKIYYAGVVLFTAPIIYLFLKVESMVEGVIAKKIG